MNRLDPLKPPLPRGADALAAAACELALLREQAARERATLSLLQDEVLLARTQLSDSQGALLVDANEHLVIAMLRSQIESETMTRSHTQEKIADGLRLEGQRLEAENRQLLAASELKNEFLSMMSHELRTPLNAVIGFSELISMGAVARDPVKCQKLGGHILNSGRHLLAIINDILDLAKIESGKFDIHPEPVNLFLLVDEVIQILSPSATEGGVVVSASVDPMLTGLVVDPLRLRQVLFNFLSNAIKFTRPGGQVTVRARPDGSEDFRIEVEDTGIGVTAEDQAKLFVPFQQIDGGLTRSREGTGLGLALTRKLAEFQGGSVGMRSTPGVGSVFHLVLKRQPLPVLQGKAQDQAGVHRPFPRS